MKQDIKDKWVAALRSGNYKQGTGELRKVKDDGCTYHCCLGVLAEVAGIKIRGLGTVSKDGDTSTDYQPLQDLIDEDSDKKISTEHFYILNDREKLSFDKIADRIEKEL